MWSTESAVRMYREIGFAEIGGRTAWLRGAGGTKSCRNRREWLLRPASFALRKTSEWGEEYALWREVSPYGTAWNTPLDGKGCSGRRCRKSLEGSWRGRRRRHFLARCGGRVEAALSAFSHYSGLGGRADPARGHPGKGGGRSCWMRPGRFFLRIRAFCWRRSRRLPPKSSYNSGSKNVVHLYGCDILLMEVPYDPFSHTIGYQYGRDLCGPPPGAGHLQRLRPGQGLVVESTNWAAIVVLALILGLVNSLLAPLLKFLTCPFILITLGLFTLLINTFLFWLTGQIGGVVRLRLPGGFSGLLPGRGDRDDRQYGPLGDLQGLSEEGRLGRFLNTRAASPSLPAIRWADPMGDAFLFGAEKSNPTAKPRRTQRNTF